MAAWIRSPDTVLPVGGQTNSGPCRTWAYGIGQRLTADPDIFHAAKLLVDWYGTDASLARHARGLVKAHGG
jgi:hypothetical protein